jgi:hypothetical protein
MTPIHITTYTGFTDFDRARMAQVVSAANRLLADPRFKERIQSISHFDSSTDSGFAVWARLDAADLGISATLYTLPWYKRFSKEDAKDLPDGVAIVRGRLYRRSKIFLPPKNITLIDFFTPIKSQIQ